MSEDNHILLRLLLRLSLDDLLLVQRQWASLLIQGLPPEVMRNRITHIRSMLMLLKPSAEVSNILDYGNKADRWYKTWEYILDVLMEDLDYKS